MYLTKFQNVLLNYFVVYLIETVYFAHRG